MNSYLRQVTGDSTADLFDLLVEFIFNPYDFSETIKTSRRTYDAIQQAFTGWGMVLVRDDLIKINDFLKIHAFNLLDMDMLNGALQRSETDRGLDTGETGFSYNHGK